MSRAWHAFQGFNVLNLQLFPLPFQSAHTSQPRQFTLLAQAVEPQRAPDVLVGNPIVSGTQSLDQQKIESSLVGGFNPFEKYARQNGSFPQVGLKIKNIRNHQLDHQPSKASFIPFEKHEKEFKKNAFQLLYINTF